MFFFNDGYRKTRKEQILNAILTRRRLKRIRRRLNSTSSFLTWLATLLRYYSQQASVVISLVCFIGSWSFKYNCYVIKILEMNPEDDAEEDGANIDLDSQRKGQCVVLKTSTRQVRLQYTFSHVRSLYIL